MNLIQKYGSCLLKKDSLLFRSNSYFKSSDSLFFGFHPGIARAFSTTKKIEVWRLKEDIQLLFMIKEVDCRSWTKSAIEEIYKSFFPGEDECNDLDIKHFNKDKRAKLIQKLIQQGINGWFSSLENHYELEVCLFRESPTIKQVTFKEIWKNSTNEFNFINALKKALIQPCDEFYKISNLNLRDCPFTNYKNYMKEIIEYECKFGSTRRYSENSNYTLRLKLGI